MFKKKNSYNIESYKEFIKELIVDKKIRDDVLEKINFFNKNGVLFFDGNNLYGKIINKEGNDFIEIKYENQKFNCFYTEWQSKRRVSINQLNLKDNQKHIEIEEKNNYVFPEGSMENESSFEKIEKIYDSNNKLIYESKTNQNDTHNSTKDFVMYKNAYFHNFLEIEKKWFVPNGTILKYTLTKDLNNEVKESYSICPQKINNEFENLYLFNKIDKNIFVDFVTGKITIEEVLKLNKNEAEETYKQHCKTRGTIDII